MRVGSFLESRPERVLFSLGDKSEKTCFGSRCIYVIYVNKSESEFKAEVVNFRAYDSSSSEILIGYLRLASDIFPVRALIF